MKFIKNLIGTYSIPAIILIPLNQYVYLWNIPKIKRALNSQLLLGHRMPKNNSTKIFYMPDFDENKNDEYF